MRRSASKIKNKKDGSKNTNEHFSFQNLLPRAAMRRTIKQTPNMLTLRPRTRQTADARSQRFQNENS